DLLAAFPAHCAAQPQSHVPPLMILCWFISNSCEAVISAGLTRYLVGRPIRFRSLRDAGIFCLCAVIIGPFLSSFLDAAFVVWNHWGQDVYWKLIRRFSFYLCHSFFGRRYDSAPWGQAVLFRLSAFWPFGADPMGMDRSQAEQPNKTRSQSKYF